MQKTYDIPVKKVEKITPLASLIELDIPEALKEEMVYIPGQHITLQAEIDGEIVRRSYSLCSCPGENKWAVGIKKVPGGVFSTFANDKLKSGIKLSVSQPMGRFKFQPDPKQEGTYVFIAAGSGITPIFSMIKSILFTERESGVILLYGNQNTENIMFSEDLENLKNKFLGRMSVSHVLSQEHQFSELFNGRIGRDKLEAFNNILFKTDETDQFFICGPKPMIFECKEWLENQNVPLERIHFELFNSKVTDSERSRVTKAAPKGGCTVVVTKDGMTSPYVLDSKQVVLLDALNANGAGLPFACKGGVCCTCKAMLEDGQVNMIVNYGLEPDEIENGYILTCQAVPQDDAVTINFDI